jgi:hypothetical protein
MKKILIACEESQVITKAFRDLGFFAYSNDLKPCSGGHPEWHLQCDVLQLLKLEWDLIIAHPPCTDLATSGARHFAEKIADGRQQQGIDFFMKFVNCSCPRVAIENPIGIMSSKYRKPDQIIQPYEYGHNCKKSTCLWLKGLPKLVPTNIVDPGEMVTFPSGKTMSKWYYETSKLSPKERSEMRSKTFDGVGKAIAEQWSKVL